MCFFVARISIVVLHRTIFTLELVAVLIVGVVVDVRRRWRRLKRVADALYCITTAKQLAVPGFTLESHYFHPAKFQRPPC